LKRWPRLLGVLVLGLAGYLLFTWAFPPDEKVIRGLLEQVAAKATIKPGEGNFARMKAVSDLVGYFATDVAIALEGVPGEAREIQGVGSLRELAVAARTQLRFAEVSFQDIFVEVDPGRDTATARAIGRARISGMDQPWYQELKVSLRKVDGNWKIARVESAKGLTM
jgi:hypothetical protein